ncbi:MAG: phosphate ABC transporter ATP-binding protein [Planctomycetales bacterium]|nr:phosphate ABC transporter ATP-binding protein [Planctomycetales bacterium]
MIRVESLAVSYGSRRVLRDIRLEVPQGTTLAVVGPSGCGKSTFLSCLNRLIDLIPGAAVSGRILLRGQDLLDSRTDLIALRRRVGMVFQKPNPFPTTIRRNMQLALIEHGVRSRGERDRLTQQTLEEVGLWDEVFDRLDSPANQLSGGQQQRLCLARSLALSPEVILMDEPCSALDPVASSRIEGLIQSLKGRLTQIVVTHNLAQARRIADDVAIFWISDAVGTVIETGPVEQVWRQPTHPISAAYLSGQQG